MGKTSWFRELTLVQSSYLKSTIGSIKPIEETWANDDFPKASLKRFFAQNGKNFFTSKLKIASTKADKFLDSLYYLEKEKLNEEQFVVIPFEQTTTTIKVFIVLTNYEILGFIEGDVNDETVTTVWLHYNDLSLKEILVKLFKDLKETEEDRSLYVASSSNWGGGLQLRALQKVGKTLVQENYSAKVLSDFEAIKNNINSKDSSSRLSILSGPPGTGKSYFLMGLVNACKKAKFIYLPASSIETINGPNLMKLFGDEALEKETLVLVIEDADEALVSRDRTNLGAISTMLNLGSGVLGAAFNFRVIATTNAPKLELDKAITRPGRLFRFVEINNLSPEEATICYKHLTGEDKEFSSPTSLAEIYTLKENQPIFPLKKETKLGF